MKQVVACVRHWGGLAFFAALGLGCSGMDDGTEPSATADEVAQLGTSSQPIGVPDVPSCASQSGFFPVLPDDAEIARLRCEPSITALGTIITDAAGQFSIRAALLTVPSGDISSRAAAYGLDQNGDIVCQAFATIASGASSASCPPSADSWVARVEQP